MTTVIKAEGLSKSYVIGHRRDVPYGTLRDSLAGAARGFASRLAHPFVGSNSPNGSGDTQEEFWALRDVSFEVQEGERVGIIGRNGAGKSTLLKILSRITEPTRGRVEIRGRVASLLEVGTGFHPELTGRENIYLNGAVLGMSRADIRSKFDEIVAFAEVEQFLDTPVKRYSSGMYVRLAFAVAAHLEPDILVVDEVLAVGDTQFQKKCLGKMEEVGRGGRTVLFVSHNLTALRNLCTSGLLLDRGSALPKAGIDAILGEYVFGASKCTRVVDLPATRDGHAAAYLRRVAVAGVDSSTTGQLSVDTPIDIEVDVNVSRDDADIAPFLHCYDGDGILVFSSGSFFQKELSGVRLARGTQRFRCRIPENLLNDGEYTLDVMLVSNRVDVISTEASIIRFRVDDSPLQVEGWHWRPRGVIRPQLIWQYEAQ